MAGKSKKPEIKKLQINLTNRWLYTLIVFFSLIVIGVFVYATTPNPGHDITQIAPPNVCSDDQFLQWTASGWACAEAGGSNLWTQSGSDIYYNTGKVSIGTSAATWPLHVEGTAYIDDYLGIGVINPAHRLHVDGTVRADVFRGSGSGLWNLRVIVTPTNDVCSDDNDGILRYKSNYCSGNNQRSSYFDICMRQGDSSYGWYNMKYYNWYDYSCNTDGCPEGQTYYECEGGFGCSNPGCYDSEPEDCFDCEIPAP